MFSMLLNLFFGCALYFVSRLYLSESRERKELKRTMNDTLKEYSESISHYVTEMHKNFYDLDTHERLSHLNEDEIVSDAFNHYQILKDSLRKKEGPYFLRTSEENISDEKTSSIP